MAGICGQVHKADTGLTVWVLPSQLRVSLNEACGAGQLELQVQGTANPAVAGQADTYSVFAEIGTHRSLQFAVFRILKAIHDRHFDRNPARAPALTFHQCAGRPKTALGPLGRNRLIEDEVRSQSKCCTDIALLIDDGNRHSFLVGRSMASCLKNLAGYFGIFTIDYDCFEAAAAQLLDRQFCIGAQFDGDFQVIEDASQDTNDLLVRTEHERLQIHSRFHGRAGRITVQVT